METVPKVTQTVDKYGFIITSKNLQANLESDIKDVNPDKVEKHVEMKLWIKDLICLTKTEEEKFYSYCGILLNIVDIYGVIVSVKSNAFGILYKVDDGTGEIDCWKDNRSEINAEKYLRLLEASEDSFGETTHPNEPSVETSIFSENAEDISIANKIEKEREIGQWLREQILKGVEKTSFVLGSTVHLRGKLSDFRGERCIRIYNIRHVTDVNEEIDRRFELVHLYQTVYSQKI